MFDFIRLSYMTLYRFEEKDNHKIINSELRVFTVIYRTSTEHEQIQTLFKRQKTTLTIKVVRTVRPMATTLLPSSLTFGKRTINFFPQVLLFSII